VGPSVGGWEVVVGVDGVMPARWAWGRDSGAGDAFRGLAFKRGASAVRMGLCDVAGAVANVSGGSASRVAGEEETRAAVGSLPDGDAFWGLAFERGGAGCRLGPSGGGEEVVEVVGGPMPAGRAWVRGSGLGVATGGVGPT
jgi:hypothetical protein